MKREIKVKEEVKDHQVCLEKLESKEKRENQELVHLAPLASQVPQDHPDHVVYLMETMPWALGLETWIWTLKSSGDLLVHLGLLVLLDFLDHTCLLIQREYPTVGLLGLLEKMDYKEDLGYRDLQGKMELQVYQDKRGLKVTKGWLAYLDQRVNVAQLAPLAIQDGKDPVVPQDREDQRARQDHLGHQDSQDPSSLLRIWRVQERVTC